MKTRTSWEPGQSGNPHGRPKKGETYTDIINDIGNTLSDDIERKKMICLKLYEMAEGGDLAAIKYIMDRVDGTPTYKHDVDSHLTVIFDTEDEEL